MTLNSSTVAVSDVATASQYNNVRKDVVQYAGDYGTATGSANAYVLAVDAQIVTAYVERTVFKFKANFTNTGACTLNVNSLGAKSIVKHGTLALKAGDIQNGQVVEVIYDGTNMQMISLGNVVTTKGDMAVGSGTNDYDRLAVGTNDYVLVADSTQTLGMKWAVLAADKKILNVYTNVTVSNTTTETTLATVSVTGGSLSTDNILKGNLWISTVRGAGAGTLTIRLKYGGTTLITHTITLQNSALGAGEFKFELRATGATNTQEAESLFFTMSNVVGNTFPASIYDYGTSGTAAVDSTADQTLAITAQFSAADVNYNMTVTGGTIHLIRS